MIMFNIMKKYITLYFLFICLFSYSQRTLTFPAKKTGDYEKYISKDSLVFQVSQKLEIGMPSNGSTFVFLTQGNMEPVGAHISGDIITIRKIRAIGKSQTGYKGYFIIRGYGLANLLIDIENALKTGEILLID